MAYYPYYQTYYRPVAEPNYYSCAYGYCAPPNPYSSGSVPSRSQNTGSCQRFHATDPSDYGWHFHGRNEQARVELWTSPDGVKLDYYYTTGTVKTCMDHPRQGKTQMFRRNLSERQFQRVLANPREHTGRGYQRRGTAGYYQGLQPQDQ